MKRAMILALLLFSACGGDGGGDDTDKVPVVVPVPPQQPSVSTTTDDDTCPITFSAESEEEAVAEAEESTGGIATDVEDLGLDQGAALRTYRVWVKDISVTVLGCDNHVSVSENHPTTTVTNEPQVQQ